VLEPANPKASWRKTSTDRPNGRSNMQVMVMKPEINDSHTGPG